MFAVLFEAGAGHGFGLLQPAWLQAAACRCADPMGAGGCAVAVKIQIASDLHLEAEVVHRRDPDIGAVRVDRGARDPPRSPAGFLAEFPAISHEQLLGVLHGMAEAMAYVDALKTLRLSLDPGDPNDPIAQDAHSYLRERLARRAVVEAWRDEMIAAERTPEAE